MQTFSYVYCLIHQSVVVFCLVFLRKSAAQFFRHVHVSSIFRGRSALQFFSNVHDCFVFLHVQFLYLPILVMFFKCILIWSVYVCYYLHRLCVKSLILCRYCYLQTYHFFLYIAVLASFFKLYFSRSFVYYDFVSRKTSQVEKLES